MKHSIRTLAALGLATTLATPLLANEMDQDLRIRLEAMEEAIEGLNAKTSGLSKANFEGFVNLRYDDERQPNRATQPETPANQDDNGQSGIYARRAEAKFYGKLAPTATWSLGYDFAENKMKDLGVQIDDLTLVPFMDSPMLKQTVRVGQYRIPFGVVAQTSSSAILFPERSFMNGGRLNRNTQLSAATSLSERVMGVQGRWNNKNGVVDLTAQYGFFNNLAQDQAAGQNRMHTAFTNQDNDQDMSYATRLVLDHSYLNGLLPEKSKIATGFSYGKESNNPNFQSRSGHSYSEAQGGDLVIELANKMIIWHTEWVKVLGNITTAGVGSHGEAWYSDMAIDLLPLISSEIEKGDALQTLFRVEEQLVYTAAGFHKPLTRIATGLKFSYWGGKNHTSLTYYVAAPEHMYGGDFRRAGADRGTGISAPETTLVLQQQWAWDTK